ncbi:RagB/SusD family nutrient uptake outer membrane protein [Spirosoma sp. KUDC1026]|uniref:RagB/SusD family nutrient uptake outer membrane protein n=1 Tax=Spirosoma sp. KUDC1026 TaxID=2745947 RepID=UPI00159BD542|nr:RagB/SusD family nutrient uptake outer membrane protein [Spirosoma sp. KUDC1026]QKZ14687.1 RagB/SusD family nutrient uptake outer membrane protein [Spirosoma sp. KUDC1026]
MKRIPYFLLSSFLMLSGLTLISCDRELLDTVPNDRLSESVFWRTENDARLAVNSLYTDLDSTNIISWDALTDIAHTNQPFDVQAYIEMGQYDATSSKVLNEWIKAYRGVRACNYFLQNVDKVASTNTALISQFKGEARALRAYQYLKLAALFGDVPLLTAPISLDESRTLTRTPVAQVWDFVDKELTEAAGLLPLTYAAADKGRVTKGAALGLRARSNLFAGRYQQAAEAADQVMKLGVYGLYESYEKLFTTAAENNKEVLLDRQFVKDTYPINVFNLLAPYSQKNATSTYVPTKALVDMYETTTGKVITDPTSSYDPANPYQNRDPRLNYSVFLAGDPLPSGATFQPAPNSGTADAVGNTYIASTTGFNIKKYVNAEDYANPVNGGINIILLRYAEILLTYAEAKIELNQLDASVISAINLVRNSRADVKQPAISSTATQAELRAIVRRERTVELAFEGVRLFDIRRRKTAETVLPGPVYGITYKADNGALATVQVVAVNRVFDKSRHYLWPVPQRELYLTPSLTQTAGW